MIRNRALSTPILLCLLAAGASAGTRYVNAALGSGTNDGTSWANAFQGSNGLQAALAVAVAGDQIWVAQGSYEPTAGATRSIYFLLRNGVEIYGGFDGTESSLAQRDFVAHLTVLTGDLNGDDGSSLFTDNSYHVVDATGTNATAVLDGFRVRGGNANVAAGNQDRGGGILCIGGVSPTIRNCVFRENRCTFGGGAGYVNNSSPSFTDCRFESNFGASFGGAFDTATNANSKFVRCVFSGNSAARAGALELFSNSNATLTNCVFWNNTSTGAGGGGALFVSNSNPTIRNCIIAGNRSNVHQAGGVLASPAIALANDIVYFNEGPGGVQGLSNNITGANCTWCCVQGIAPGASGNIAADPLFLSLATGDLHLAANSPCADAGANGSLPANTTTDLDGNPRLADDPIVPDTGGGGFPVVDIGAYELPNTLYQPFCAGDGSLATACPCGNTGALGHGCRNSDPLLTGSLLVASGTSTPDTAVLTASEMLSTSSCVFLQGNLSNPGGALFGDGVRCVAGSLKRLYLKSASNGTASAPGVGDLSISARSAALGDPIAPGSQRFYQVYYRDSNLGFCPAPQGNSWNVSSGVAISW